jgi:hypothetical protein
MGPCRQKIVRRSCKIRKRNHVLNRASFLSFRSSGLCSASFEGESPLRWHGAGFRRRIPSWRKIHTIRERKGGKWRLLSRERSLLPNVSHSLTKVDGPPMEVDRQPTQDGCPPTEVDPPPIEVDRPPMEIGHPATNIRRLPLDLHPPPLEVGWSPTVVSRPRT